MDNNDGYSINEAADFLNLSAKTIRRYIKSGKLPSTKVATKFGDEYRITEIPEDLKKEAAGQANAKAQVNRASTVEVQPSKLDAGQLYQENIRLAAQLGAATERLRQMEEQVKLQESLLKPAQEKIKQLEEQLKLLEAPKKEAGEKAKAPWWKRIFGGGKP
jgi:MerR family transcriptional regulator, copper efflux regulator